MAGKRLNKSNAMAVFCAAILVGTEILAAALALGWAAGGLMGWDKDITNALIGICLVIGCYVTYVFVRNAAKIEPIFE